MSARPTLRRRLAAFLILTAVVSLALAALVGTSLIRRAEERTALAELRRQAQAIAGEAALVGGEPRPTLRLVRQTLNLSDASLYRIGAGRVVLVGGEPQFDLAARDIEQLRAGRPVEGRTPTAAGEALYVARPIAGPRSRLALVLARTVQQGPRIPLGPATLAAAGLAIAAAAGMSLILSKRISGPVNELADAARDLAGGDRSRRVSVDADDEIAVLAEAFNTMADELQADESMQRDFLMSISHELRTPLTAIQGYAEAIEDGTAGADGVRAAGVIVGESKRLARLVSDLLDLARLDARRFSVHPEPVDVPGVLETVRGNFARTGSEVDLVAEGCDATVRADRDRLIQVLSNLVENSLRYTPAGGRIVLSCSEGDRVTIEVTDTGPGFEDEDLARAFERQYLWSKYRGLREVGTGLGLVITRELAQLMEGEVRAANVPSGGARFSVILPAEREGTEL